MPKTIRRRKIIRLRKPKTEIAFTLDSDNDLIKLLKAFAFPDKDWFWNCLSRNPNITWNFVRANLNEDWNWQVLFKNPNITWEFVEADFTNINLDNWNYNPNIDWNWCELLYHPNITQEIIPELMCRLCDDEIFLMRYVRNISKNPNITWDFVQANLSRYQSQYWDWYELSLHPNITWNIIDVK